MSNNLMKFSKKRQAKVVISMIVGTIIYCMSVVWILDLGQFYAGGVTGFSQLIVNGLALLDIHISKSIFIAIFNVPLFIIGWKGVSKRFALLSLGSVALQVVMVYLFERLAAAGFNPIADAFMVDGALKPSAMLTIAVLGGLVCGVGSGISLRNGASTGGMDILSQYFSFKKNIPFTSISLSVDLGIILLSMLIGNMEIALYTIIRLIITILVLDRIHTIYNFMRVQIVTENVEEMRAALISNFNHGVTIYEARGGYSNNKKWVLESVVSSYEAEEYKNIAYKIDANPFITFTTVKHIYGNFNRNAIT